MGNHISPRQTGFTLMELLVVIFIIGMIMTFAALSVGGGGDRAVEEEAKRLTALMRLAVDESIMNSRDMVLQLAKTQYSFMQMDRQTRQLVPMAEDDTIFRPRELPDSIMFKRAEIGGENVSLSVEPAEDEEPPSIFILSSGEVSPFTLEIGQDDGPTFEVVGDFAGQVDFERLEI